MLWFLKLSLQYLQIRCDWDKTSDYSGASTVHIPKELNSLMKIYLMKRLKQFKQDEKYKAKELNLNQLLFVNANGKAHKPNLNHVNEGNDSEIKLVPYDHRKKVSSWAQNHPDQVIRDTEPEALQHQPSVAKENYLLNKSKKPMDFVQKYKTEREVFPERIAESIAKAEEKVKDLIDEQDAVGKERRKEELMRETKEKKVLRRENQALGAKRKILHKHCVKFVDLVKKSQGEEVLKLLVESPPLVWRHQVVRIVTAQPGSIGEEMRDLWVAIYR